MPIYIDVDKLKHILLVKANQELNVEIRPFSWSFAYKCFAQSLDAIPPEDVAPVVHAEWEDNGANYKCSNCGNTEPYYDMLYCPHCGAKMDEEEPDV